jgi:hypothetical protein
MFTTHDFRRYRAWPALLMSALVAVLALAGCAPGEISTSVATPAPTSTSAPHTVYQADWSQGADGWTLPPHWSVSNGALVNDGGGTASIQIPYQVTDKSYSIHLQIRVLGVNAAQACGAYGLLGQSTANALLYTAVVHCLDHKWHSFSLLYPAKPDASQSGYADATADFTPGTQTRSYLLQVDGPYISFTPGGSYIGTVKSGLPLDPSRLVLEDQYVQMQVESLSITTP